MIIQGDTMPTGTLSAAPAAICRDLAGEIRPLLRSLDLAARREDSRFGLTRARSSILCTLAERGGLRISELARSENVRVPTASNAIRSLEEQGMVVRTADHTDKRAVTVHLTDHGRDSVARTLAERDADLELRLLRLDAAQRQGLADALPALRTLVDLYAGDPFGS